jgi:hypothetical protein
MLELGKTAIIYGHATALIPILPLNPCFIGTCPIDWQALDVAGAGFTLL